MKKIRKRFLFLNLFIVLMPVLCLLITVCSAKTYTAKIETYRHQVTSVRYETENDHISVTDVRIENDAVYITAEPNTVGKCGVDIYCKTDEPEAGEQYHYLSFAAGAFHTIFNIDPALDFRGGRAIILIILITVTTITVTLTVSYFDYLRRSDFGYPMIACMGISLFCSIYLMIDLLTLSYYISTSTPLRIGQYLYGIASSGETFNYFIAPFMAVFSVAVIFSNIALIRHEGFRALNLLGVFFGLLWFGGITASVLFSVNASGSSLHGKIYTAVSSGIAIVVSYFECLLFSTVLTASLASKNKPPFDRDYIIILGCAIRKDGSLTPLLKARVDAAIGFMKEQREKTGRRVRFVPSGGQGSDEVISEGEAMKRYLLSQGIDAADILSEEKSVNTFENIKFSKAVIEQDTDQAYHAAFATTNYHIFRGYILSKKNNLKNARGISAKTKWYFFPNAFLRELVGLVVDEWKTNLLWILLLVVAVVTIICLQRF